MILRLIQVIAYFTILLSMTGCITTEIDDGFSHLSSDKSGLVVISSRHFKEKTSISFAKVDYLNRKFLTKPEEYSLLFKLADRDEANTNFNFRAVELPPGQYVLTAIYGSGSRYEGRGIKYCNARDALVFEVKAGTISVLDYTNKYSDNKDAAAFFKQAVKKYKAIKAEIIAGRKIATIGYASEPVWPCLAKSQNFTIRSEF